MDIISGLDENSFGGLREGWRNTDWSRVRTEEKL